MFAILWTLALPLRFVAYVVTEYLTPQPKENA